MIRVDEHEHVSVWCQINGDMPHAPCTGACDEYAADAVCALPCRHWCHSPTVRILPPVRWARRAWMQAATAAAATAITVSVMAGARLYGWEVIGMAWAATTWSWLAAR